MIRQISDLGTLAGYGSQDLNPFNLASDMALSYEARFAQLTADCASLLTTNTVGSASVDMTVDLFFSAIASLQNADSGRGADASQSCIVLHPVALNSLQDSLRSESNNAVSMMQATHLLKIAFHYDLMSCWVVYSKLVAGNFVRVNE